MKDTNKQNDEVIMSREHQALIKFRDFPIFYEDDGTTSDDCYHATLYKYDGVWTVEWLNDEGQSIFECEADDICDVIEKAYNWAKDNISKNFINMKIYHIYIFDYNVGAIYHKSTDNVHRNKTKAVNNDGTWDFELLITELGFNVNNIQYLISEKPLDIVHL